MAINSFETLSALLISLINIENFTSWNKSSRGDMVLMNNENKVMQNIELKAAGTNSTKKVSVSIQEINRGLEQLLDSGDKYDKKLLILSKSNKVNKSLSGYESINLKGIKLKNWEEATYLEKRKHENKVCDMQVIESHYSDLPFSKQVNELRSSILTILTTVYNLSKQKSLDFINTFDSIGKEDLNAGILWSKETIKIFIKDFEIIEEQTIKNFIKDKSIPFANFVYISFIETLADMNNIDFGEVRTRKKDWTDLKYFNELIQSGDYSQNKALILTYISKGEHNEN